MYGVCIDGLHSSRESHEGRLETSGKKSACNPADKHPIENFYSICYLQSIQMERNCHLGSSLWRHPKQKWSNFCHCYDIRYSNNWLWSLLVWNDDDTEFRERLLEVSSKFFRYSLIVYISPSCKIPVPQKLIWILRSPFACHQQFVARK